MIRVYTGPMKSGKSTLLLRSIKNFKDNEVLVFKPIIDTRTPKLIMSRDGISLDAIEVNTFKDILDIVKTKSNIKAIFIDECQFFNDDINYLKDINDLNINIYISGLNYTSDRKPFNKMIDIINMADEVTTLTATCENCLVSEATLTYCTCNDKDEDILIGDDVYIAVCENCYNRLTNNKI